KIPQEIRELIRRLAGENSDWGAPKIHGELLKLGFQISERSVARYLQRVAVAIRVSVGGVSPEPPGRHRGLRLLHRADGDVPVALLLLRHRAPPPENPALERDLAPDGRLGHPTVARSVSTGRAVPLRVLDRDAKFDREVILFLKATGLTPKR